MLYNLFEAKTHLSNLVDRAAKGEEILIAKAGVPLAKLIPVPKPIEKRKPGRWKGKVYPNVAKVEDAADPRR